jgi:predicted RNA-binding Zn ribbon-like protein
VSTVSFPVDWLDPRSGEVASDLDLVVLLVNTVDLLEATPDRLTDLSWLRGALREVGHGSLAGELRTGDLAALRTLREGLRAVFECADHRRLPRLLNPLLEGARAVPLLVNGPGGALHLSVGPDRRGLAALQARLPAALAAHVAEHGLTRLGVCAGSPCQCAFVDRTRGATRRYCCTYCNDRTAARAYRSRRRSSKIG